MLKKLIFIWVGRTVLILMLIFLGFSVATCFMKGSEPPSLEDAPWAIQTYSNDQFRVPSRIYYAESIKVTDGYPVARGYWWSFNGEDFQKHKGDKPFPFNEYGKVDIRRR